MEKCRDCGKPTERTVRCRSCQDKANLLQNQQRRKRLVEGSCSSCGDSLLSNNKRCQSCVDKTTKSYANRKIDRLNRCICLQCGQRSASINRQQCSECLDKATKKKLQLSSTRINKGLCSRCGKNPIMGNQKSCIDCLDKTHKSNKLRAEKLKRSGLCISCGRFPILGGVTRIGTPNQLCKICYIKHVSQFSLGSSRHSDLLLEKLERQEYKCPYTDDDLVIGGNAWIDHIMPRSKFPELAHNIENLEWVTEDVNRAKQDKTPEEFLELVAKIYSKRLQC